MRPSAAAKFRAAVGLHAKEWASGFGYQVSARFVGSFDPRLTGCETPTGKKKVLLAPFIQK